MRLPLTLLTALLWLPCALNTCAADRRDFAAGRLIPDDGYCDQPYIVTTKDGGWLCTMTTGPGGESQPGQHVVATISRDRGRTWSELIAIEPSGKIESSWVVPLVVASGRVYAFYNYNGDDVRSLDGKPIKPPTLLGWYVFKYSDDHGRTWSAERYRLPMPVAEVDRGNDWQGRVQLFWGVDKPILLGGDALFAFTRMGKFIHDLGEGWFYRSDNLLTERDPAKIRWRLLPETARGVRHPGMGSVQEEHNVVPLANGALYTVYRTMRGYAGGACSRDGGRTWTTPEPVAYTPGGRKIKTPRACAMIWQAANGKYLLWIHNTALQLHSKVWPMTGRDLAWLVGGVERNGAIHWSQPEVVCYVTPRRGVSYPDLVEADGRYWISATNKREARLIEVDRELVESLWRQEIHQSIARAGLVLEAAGPFAASTNLVMPRLPSLANAGGFALDFWLRRDTPDDAQVVLDSRDGKSGGIVVTTAANHALRLTMDDGRTKVSWESDPGRLTPGQLHHVSISVDGGPKTISFVINGQLCDGGDDPERPFGTGRFFPVENSLTKEPGKLLGDVSGSGKLKVAPSLRGQLRELRIYNRYLRTGEAIGNCLAAPVSSKTSHL